MSEMIPQGWENYKFKEVCSIVNGQVDPKVKPYRDMKHIGPGNIEKFTGKLEGVKSACQDGQISGKYLFDKTNVLYGKINPHFAKVAFPKYEGVCSADMYPVICSDYIVPDFLFYLLLSEEFTRYAVSVSGRTGMPKINREDLDVATFNLPSLFEQQKIASFLTSVDDVIEKTQQQINKLQDLKKATMNELLTKGIGHTEFKDSELGRIPESWSITKLDGISDFVTSGSRGWAEYYSEEGAVFIRIGNLTRENINFRWNDIVKVSPPQGREGSRTRVQEGDLLISITADLGIIGVVGADLPEAYINQHVALVRFADSSIGCARYIGHFLSHEIGQKQFRSSNDSGAKAGLNLPTIKNIKICLPSVDEAKKISNIVDSIDLNLSKHKRKILKLNDLKKSLMNDLLTGKVRVKVN